MIKKKISTASQLHPKNRAATQNKFLVHGLQINLNPKGHSYLDQIKCTSLSDKSFLLVILL